MKSPSAMPRGKRSLEVEPESSGLPLASVRQKRVQAKQPQIIKSHNAYHDGRRTAQVDMYNELVRWLHENVEQDRDILPIHSHYKRMARERDQVGDTAPDEMWPDLRTIQGLDFEFLVNWLTRHSDLSPSDLVQLRRDDGDTVVLLRLLKFATQLSSKTVLPKELRVKALMVLFLDKLDTSHGKRLSNIKSQLIFNEGQVDWQKLLAFTPIYNEEGQVCGLRHVQGDVVEVDTDMGFTEKFDIIEAFLIPALRSSRVSLRPHTSLGSSSRRLLRRDAGHGGPRITTARTTRTWRWTSGS